MGVRNFVDNGVKTLQHIHTASSETIKRNKLSLFEFLGKALKESSKGAYYVFLKAEIDGILKKHEIENIVNNTSDKVIYLLGGYYLSPATLLELKKEIEKQGLKTKIINQRYYSKKSLGKVSRELKNQMNQDTGKDIILFGYSAGGAIAHRIGQRDGHKSISFGLSAEPSKTMVGTLLSLTRDKNLEDTTTPENGVNIIEQFSAMVPNTGELPENTIRLDDVFSHMTIGKKEVVDEIVRQITS